MQFYKATAIRMKRGCSYSNDLLEIDSICIDYSNWYTKGDLHDYLRNNPGRIKVGSLYGPDVIPSISNNGEKYVKSMPNQNKLDNLLALPRK